MPSKDTDPEGMNKGTLAIIIQKVIEPVFLTLTFCEMGRIYDRHFHQSQGQITFHLFSRPFNIQSKAINDFFTELHVFTNKSLSYFNKLNYLNCYVIIRMHKNVKSTKAALYGGLLVQVLYNIVLHIAAAQQ